MASKRVHFSETVEDNGDEGPSCSKRARDEGEADDEDFNFKPEFAAGDVLDIRQIRAQEAGDVDEENGVRFTAFNLEEEMEEGHFDPSGNFIFKKDAEIKDNWLDNIDWVEVKKRQGDDADHSSGSDSESSAELVDRTAIYKRMVPLLQEGESVQRAIRRLGGGGARRTGKKKSEPLPGADPEKMTELIGYADDLVTDGEMDIYQFTTEKLQYLIRNAEKDNYKEIVSGKADGGADDMFSDAFDAAKPKDKKGEEEEEVMWEFRWKDDENEEIQGPFPTSKMIAWEKESYFDEVFIRRVGSEKFYPSKRIDFDLYT